jgi:hypothetical protein
MGLHWGRKRKILFLLSWQGCFFTNLGLLTNLGPYFLLLSTANSRTNHDFAVFFNLHLYYLAVRRNNNFKTEPCTLAKFIIRVIFSSATTDVKRLIHNLGSTQYSITLNFSSAAHSVSPQN